MQWPFEPFEPSAQANQGYWPAQGAGLWALTRPACATLRDAARSPITPHPVRLGLRVEAEPASFRTGRSGSLPSDSDGAFSKGGPAFDPRKEAYLPSYSVGDTPFLRGHRADAPLLHLHDARTRLEWTSMPQGAGWAGDRGEVAGRDCAGKEVSSAPAPRRCPVLPRPSQLRRATPRHGPA